TFVPQTNDYIHDFRSKVQCSREKETLHLEIKFVTNKYINSRNSRNQQKLPFGTETVQLNLAFDKTVPRYRVFKTKRNKEGNPITKSINEKVLYKRESCHPRQFKAIEEFYGTVNDDSDTF